MDNYLLRASICYTSKNILWYNKNISDHNENNHTQVNGFNDLYHIYLIK